MKAKGVLPDGWRVLLLHLHVSKRYGTEVIKTRGVFRL